jgi:hypothetical protein
MAILSTRVDIRKTENRRASIFFGTPTVLLAIVSQDASLYPAQVLNPKSECRNPKQTRNRNVPKYASAARRSKFVRFGFRSFEFWFCFGFRASDLIAATPR